MNENNHILFTLEQLSKYLDKEIQYLTNIIENATHCSFIGDKENKRNIGKSFYEGQRMAYEKLKSGLNLYWDIGLLPVNKIPEKEYKEQIEWLEKRTKFIKENIFKRDNEK